MAKILRYKEQNEVFKRLVNITVELMKHAEEIGAKDALIDVAEIAQLVGGKEMFEAMKVKK